MSSRFPIQRGFFAGSGSAAFNELSVCDALLKLVPPKPSPISLAYLGTATYDLEGPRRNQTQRFMERGCDVIDVRITEPSHTPSASELSDIFNKVDVVLVSGGNTLFAIRRFRETGIDAMLLLAAQRGAVMAGGSAGAICWFDGGHSDSMDPETYKQAMQQPPPPPAALPSGTAAVVDEAKLVDSAVPEKKPWKYIRISGLGFLPGLLCPHHDRTQSNGVPRSEDFDKMLLRHQGEQGIAIDHWAALVVEGDRYSVFVTPGQVGSCSVPKSDEDREQVKFVSDGSGVPGMWVKRVVADSSAGYVVKRRHVPLSGRLEDLICPAQQIVLDPLEEVCAQENPTH